MANGIGASLLPHGAWFIFVPRHGPSAHPIIPTSFALGEMVPNSLPTLQATVQTS